MHPLIQALDSHDTISIIGNAKNAGKTTTLNFILTHYERYGLTSIGMDGEKIDTLSQLPKPKIKVKPQAIVSTVSEALVDTGIAYELLESFAMPTPMGHIVLIRVLSEGDLLIAGPSKISELKHIVKRMEAYGVSKVFIDGAFGRLAQGNPFLASGVVLAIGASLNASSAFVFDHAKRYIDLLAMPEVSDAVKKQLHDVKNVAWIDANDHFHELPFDSVIKEFKQLVALDMQHVTGFYFPKALSKEVIYYLSTLKKALTIIIHNPTHVILSQDALKVFSKLPHVFYTVNKVNLLAVTVNPVAPGRYHFDKRDMLKKVTTLCGVGVYNVCEEAHDEQT